LKHKQNIKVNQAAPKLRAAALVFSAAFAAASCGEFPQCQVNYKAQETQVCRDALEKLKAAKAMQKNVLGYKELAKEYLKNRIEEGDECPEGLDEYNGALRNLFAVSTQLAILSNLKRQTEDGLIESRELERADGVLDSIVSQLQEIKETFLGIVEQS